MGDQMGDMTMRFTNPSLQNFEDFCRRDAFKRYVREAVNDELFWRDILGRVQINGMVDNRLVDQIPTRVRNQLNDVLPGRVTQEILNQLPGILNTNHQMQQLFSDHRSRLESALSEAAQTILDRIVNEEQYHEVNRAYFDAFKRKGDSAISNMEDRGRAAVSDMKADCDRKLSELKTHLENLDRTNARVTKLEGEISWLRYGLYSLGITMVAVVGGIYYGHHH